MKTMMVERVSNADRAGYALRASSNARQGKDQTSSSSLQERRTQNGGGANLSIAAAALDVIGRNRPFNLATTDKNDCRDKKE
jgi:hypothetical protein